MKRPGGGTEQKAGGGDKTVHIKTCGESDKTDDVYGFHMCENGGAQNLGPLGSPQVTPASKYKRPGGGGQNGGTHLSFCHSSG